VIIEDGKGSSVKAEVDANNRLVVKTSKPIAFNSLNSQEAYDFSTSDFISITSADTETGIMYLKNNEATKDLFIDSIRTCANQIHKVILYKNPTGGTLISNASTAAATNLNFNSNNTPTALYYKGAEGYTVTGGSVMSQHINDVGHSATGYNDALIIGPGDSIALTFELAAAGDCCVRIISYFQ